MSPLPINILVFVFKPATLAGSVSRRILRRKEGEFFGKCSGAHIGLEKAARVVYNKPGFFLDLLDDPLIGILSVEPSCADFDQAFPAVSQKCGQAKLPLES
jgi:hypothetical protein